MNFTIIISGFIMTAFLVVIYRSFSYVVVWRELKELCFNKLKEEQFILMKQIRISIFGLLCSVLLTIIYLPFQLLLIASSLYLVILVITRFMINRIIKETTNGTRNNS